jgi:ABC-type multidrug transport system fused ATPase/permease subunit
MLIYSPSIMPKHSALSRIVFLLTLHGRRKVLLLLVGMVMVALFEVVGVASVMPFIAVASRPELIQTQPMLNTLYTLSGAATPMGFLMLLGIAMLLLLVTANFMAALVNWGLLSFSHRRGHEISHYLLNQFIRKPYVYFLTNNTSLINKIVLTQVSQLVNGLLTPSLQFLSRTIVLLALFGLLLLVNPVITLVVFAIFCSAYLVLFIAMRKQITRLGRLVPEAETKKFMAVTELFNGIKEVKLLAREPYFLERFSTPSEFAAMLRAKKETYALLPRYLLETLAYSLIIGVVLYLLSQGKSLTELLPVLALYALVGARILPTLQHIFHNITVIKFHIPLMHEICDTVETKESDHAQPATTQQLPLDKQIAIERLSFTHPLKSEPTLKDITLAIPARKITALVGATGSGKSTLADLITGILEPQSGHIAVDGQKLDRTNIRAWQNGIGYVPQHIYLLDDTIRRNIAFGITDDEINENAVQRAAELAKIDGFIRAELAEGYDSVVGEPGIRLSGGQRQRIGLARALYHNPQLLVLDEATSALDNITERLVMDAIAGLGGSKTIVVIAHRLSTVQQCDHIVLMKDGAIEAQGTYSELLAQSQTFQALVQAVAKNDERAILGTG